MKRRINLKKLRNKILKANARNKNITQPRNTIRQIQEDCETANKIMDKFRSV